MTFGFKKFIRHFCLRCCVALNFCTAAYSSSKYEVVHSKIVDPFRSTRWSSGPSGSSYRSHMYQIIPGIILYIAETKILLLLHCCCIGCLRTRIRERFRAKRDRYTVYASRATTKHQTPNMAVWPAGGMSSTHHSISMTTVCLASSRQPASDQRASVDREMARWHAACVLPGASNLQQ